jgi:hypothetical protein
MCFVAVLKSGLRTQHCTPLGFGYGTFTLTSSPRSFASPVSVVPHAPTKATTFVTPWRDFTNDANSHLFSSLHEMGWRFARYRRNGPALRLQM